MTLNVIDKINSRFKFLHKKNIFLTPSLCRLLRNSLIKPHFHYGCTAAITNLSKKLRLKLQVTQNKCISFCLLVDKMSRFCVKEFLKVNQLNVYDGHLQFIVYYFYIFYL